MVLMATAVVLVVVAFIIVRTRKTGWFVLHRKVASLGTLLALVAFLAEFTFKTVMHYPHIRSPHSIAGVISLGLLIVTPVIGSRIAATPQKYRDMHKLLGKITSVAVILTGLMGIARFIQISLQK
jgi:hypothetical protein